MFICFKLKFSYVILLYIAFLYLAEKNKALPWKLETACVGFPFTSNFILVWSVSEYPFLFISLTNLIHVYECLGDSYWFFSLSSENASLTKTFQSIIFLPPPPTPRKKRQITLLCDKIDLGVALVENITSRFILHQVLKEPTHILHTSSSCIYLIFTSQP